MAHSPDIPLDGGVPTTPRAVSKTKFLLRSKWIKRDRLETDLLQVTDEILDIVARLTEAGVPPDEITSVTTNAVGTPVKVPSR